MKAGLILIFLIFIQCKSQGNSYFSDNELNNLIYKTIGKMNTNNKEVFVFQRRDRIIIAKKENNNNFIGSLVNETIGCFFIDGAKVIIKEPWKPTYNIFKLLKKPSCDNDMPTNKSYSNASIDGYIYKIVPKNKKYSFSKVYKGNLNAFFEKAEYKLKLNEIPEPDIGSIPKIKK